MLCLVCSLISLICLGLADSVGSVWKVICQSLSSICLLFFVPVDSDLSYILACSNSLDRFVLKHRTLGFELLPVDLISLVIEILADYYVSSGYVLDGHDDVIKPCSAESFGFYELLVSLDDLYAASDDCFSYLVFSQVNDLSVLTDSEGSGPLSVQKISLGRFSLLYKI